MCVLTKPAWPEVAISCPAGEIISGIQSLGIAPLGSPVCTPDPSDTLSQILNSHKSALLSETPSQCIGTASSCVLALSTELYSQLTQGSANSSILFVKYICKQRPETKERSEIAIWILLCTDATVLLGFYMFVRHMSAGESKEFSRWDLSVVTAADYTVLCRFSGWEPSPVSAMDQRLRTGIENAVDGARILHVEYAFDISQVIYELVRCSNAVVSKGDKAGKRKIESGITAVDRRPVLCFITFAEEAGYMSCLNAKVLSSSPVIK